MKKILKTALLALCVAGGTSVSAQKLARINLEEVIVAMPEYKQMQTNMETYGKDLREMLETMQVEFNNKLNDYQKARTTLSEAQRSLKEQELQDSQTRLQEYYEKAQGDLQAKEQELTAPLVQKAQTAVKTVASKAGYTAVLPTSSLIYFNEATVADLGPDVRKELGIPASAPAAK